MKPPTILNITPAIPGLQLQTAEGVAEKFASYPARVSMQMKRLRHIILETAAEDDNIEQLTETLKWGEPSYLAKKGSTLRIDWKPKFPDRYAMYFKCTSLLVPTIKRVYGHTFNYEKNRALHFGLEAELPRKELKSCIRIALNYHRVKHLPKLGL